jgi:hemolysin-activating ACP:hemolysin acyltransferase
VERAAVRAPQRLLPDLPPTQQQTYRRTISLGVSRPEASWQPALQVTRALMATPRYQKLPIADLEWVVLEPLLRGRIAIVSAKQGKTGQPRGVVGIAIWARTSDAVNKKIEQQIRAKAFPIRLDAAEWDSGETLWLLDVFAADKALATRVLVRFKQLVKGTPLRAHPSIAQLVDPETIARFSGEV